MILLIRFYYFLKLHKGKKPFFTTEPFDGISVRVSIDVNKPVKVQK